MLSLLLCTLIGFQLLSGQSTNYTYRFGNTHGDYMVLQQAPWRAQIWGTSPTVGASVLIELSMQNSGQLIERMSVTADSNGVWRTYFNPRVASNDEYMITATSNNKTIALKSVLFGDLYVCSGQSNMQFTVDQAFNSSQEVEAANNYPYIRVFTAAEISANTTQLEVIKVEENWSVAGNTSIGHGNWSYFSAMCWFFGRNMYSYLNYPIGLIATDFGGTPVRDWSSPDALAKCNESYAEAAVTAKKRVENNGNDNKLATDHTLYTNDSNVGAIPLSGLWNAMIFPFLQTTIRGAIWYQGEADSNGQYAVPYSCQFPAMISDWRLKWSLYSDTSPDFPFGFVQLSTWNDRNNASNTPCGDNVGCTDVAIVRWAQTANYGYVPNPIMPNTFMATAIDLGDPDSPFGDIHPRYKQQVAERLTTAGKAIMYGESELYWGGPIGDTAIINGNNVVVNFRNVGEKGLVIKNSIGFEVYDKSKTSWHTVTGNVNNNGDYDIVLPIPSSIANANDVTQIRYNWYNAACQPVKGPYNCAIYDGEYNLPATPFILTITS